MEEKKKDGIIGRLKNNICTGLDIPPDVICGFSAELRGRNEADIGGCRKIVELTPERLRIELWEHELLILGEELNCNGFCSGKISVVGKIQKIIYLEKGEEYGTSCEA